MQATMETPLAGDEELQSLRAECEVQKDEIRLLMEQVLTPEAELEQDLLFQETIDRNYFLEDCLKKAERRLIRAKVSTCFLFCCFTDSTPQLEDG